jgi:uncharacterized membrane protein YgcG
MKQTSRAVLAALVIMTGAAAPFGPATAQEETSLVATPNDEAQVIGTGNFVTGGRNTRLKVSSTYHQLCTTLNNYREVCLNIVANSIMDGITVTTRSAPDGTPLTEFKFDDKSTRSLLNRTYAVARFVGRLDIVAEALENLSTNATAPDNTDAAKGKCGGNSKLTADTESNSQDCDTGSGGSSTGSTDPGGGGAGGGGGGGGSIPDAGTVIVKEYRNPDPLPRTDLHGDPLTPPTSGNLGGVPVVVVPGPRTKDVPIIVPVPRLALPSTTPIAHLWDGCIPMPMGIICANAGRRANNDPNRIPSVVPPTPPSASAGLEALQRWWVQWWPLPELDWCKLIGYGCTAKPSEYTPPKLPTPTPEQKRPACEAAYVAHLTYCEEVVGKLQTAKDEDVCFMEALSNLNDCLDNPTGSRTGLTSDTN